MGENKVLDSGLAGIRNGLEGFHRAASQIANQQAMASVNSEQLAQSMVDLKVYQHQIGASAQMVKAADQMIGSLLDIMA